MSQAAHELFLVNPGPRPPFYSVAEHLWGNGCDVDSDGNSAERDSGDWTELTLTLRPTYLERIDIDPLNDLPSLVLRIRSDHAELARRTAEFLTARTGGELVQQRP